MRAVLLILIVAVVALIAAIGTGLVSIEQTRPAQVPDIEASDKGVTARGGQTPSFDVETGTIAVGASEQNVTVPVPTLEVRPPDGQGQASNTQQAQPPGGQ